MIDLRCGDWRDVLAGVGEVDALITDPPYSERTQNGHSQVLRKGAMPDRVERTSIHYDHWDEAAARMFISSWTPRVRGWIVILTSHDLYFPMRSELEAMGRYVFHPIPCIVRGMSVRLCGDGPSSWTVWAVVARPRNAAFTKWGTLPGAYTGSRAERSVSSTRKFAGGKTLWLMRAIVRDYSRPGDLVCDPCAGYGTTLLAAEGVGRRAIGAELDPETHAKAMQRLNGGCQYDLLEGGNHG